MNFFDKSKNFETVTVKNKSKINIGDFLIGKAMHNKFGYGISSIYEVLKVENNFFCAKAVIKLSPKGFSFDFLEESLVDRQRPYYQNYYMFIPEKYTQYLKKLLVFS